MERKNYHNANSARIKDEVDFGFTQISADEKPQKVREVFESVAQNYDVMNDLMSLGLHRLWKKRLIEELQTKRNLLDIAGGTADIARAYLQKGGKHVTLCDLTHGMLQQGQARIINQNPRMMQNLSFINGDAENLPFRAQQFDYVTIAFGLRNMTFKQQALNEAHRVLKLGGRLLILEFTPVDDDGIKQFYDWWSFNILPKLGGLIAKDSDSYKYLAQSIRQFPKADEVAKMMQASGFAQCKWQKLNLGIVAIHSGYRVSLNHSDSC